MQSYTQIIVSLSVIIFDTFIGNFEAPIDTAELFGDLLRNKEPRIAVHLSQILVWMVMSQTYLVGLLQVSVVFDVLF